jgi:hypothetical protein
MVLGYYRKVLDPRSSREITAELKIITAGERLRSGKERGNMKKCNNYVVLLYYFN